MLIGGKYYASLAYKFQISIASLEFMKIDATRVSLPYIDVRP